MRTRRNQQTFCATVNGREYQFEAYTTSTRCGFCHTIQTWCDYRNITTDTKKSYYKRTWERFDYETVLRRAIEKCPKADQKGLTEILIERKAQSEREAAERFVAKFEKTWNSLSDKAKESISSAVGSIETKEQADRVMAIASAAQLLGM